MQSSAGGRDVPGYRSSKFRHNCTIRGCYIETLPSWDDVLQRLASHGGLGVTDIDGMTERNGNFLFLEQKSPGKSMTDAQRIALRKLSALPAVTVMVLREKKEGMEVLTFQHGQTEGFQPCTREGFLDALDAWAVQASASCPPVER